MSEILSHACERYLDIPCHGIVPVPLAPQKLRKRGFNQAALLARHLGRKLSLPVSFSLLNRSKETPSQAGLDPAGRFRNMKGAFSISATVKLPGTVLLLVDDIYTTGATMNECAKTLRGAGATEIFGVVFACAPAKDMIPPSEY